MALGKTVRVPRGNRGGGEHSRVPANRGILNGLNRGMPWFSRRPNSTSALFFPINKTMRIRTTEFPFRLKSDLLNIWGWGES